MAVQITGNAPANETRAYVEYLENKYNRKLKTLDIMYKKEITYGDKIISQTEINKNSTNHVLKLKNSDEIICFLFANWNEI